MSQNSGPGYKQYPGHKITIQPSNARCRVVLNGQVIADTPTCLRLDEGRYPPVYYLPMAAVQQQLLSPSTTTTYCPFKGTASYWHIATPGSSGGNSVQDALWGYPEPFDEVLELANYVAFYPNKVDAIEILDPA